MEAIFTISTKCFNLHSILHTLIYCDPEMHTYQVSILFNKITIMFYVLFIVSLGQLKKKILREWSMYQFGSRTVAIVISDVLALYKTLCTQRCCHTYQTSSSSSLFYYKSLNTHQIIIKYKYSCHCNQRRACFTLTSPLVLNVVVIHLRHHYHRHHHQHRCRNTITAAIVIKLTNHWIHIKL